MAVEMPFMRLIADLLPAFILLVVVAAVAQHAERIERDALTALRVHRDLPEHLRRDERIEVRKQLEGVLPFISVSEFATGVAVLYHHYRMRESLLPA